MAMSQTKSDVVELASRLESAVSTRNISKNYGEVEALRDLSLEFPKGQLTSLLGPSGCGKTTLLKIIAGEDLETTARIRTAVAQQRAA